MSKHAIVILSVMGGVTIGFGALAQANVPLSGPPAPANVANSLPDLHVAEKDLGDDRKYIVFHKVGVTVQQAEEDMKFCWRFLPRGVQRSAPSFVLWGQNAEKRAVTYDNVDGGSYGIAGVVVGSVIGSIIDGPIERSVRQSRLYSCMLPRGYARYRTSEAVWKILNDDTQPMKSIQLQARIAAGPTPPTTRMEP